jgi:nucleotide-binding universal stress UspA family protein
MEFRRILFPVDFSTESYRVAPHVRAMAERFGASVTLGHVLETTPLWAAAEDAALVPDFDTESLQRAAEQRLRKFADEVLPDLRPNQVVDQGRPGPCMARLAKTLGADLIALPTHGHGPFRTALLGSTTSVVLHDSDSAVWTAAHMKDGSPVSHLAWNNILCAIDLVPESIPMIRAAAELGRKCGAAIRLVHAVSGARMRNMARTSESFEQFLNDVARKEVSSMQTQAGTNLEVLLEAGDVSKAVRETAARQNADLVIIGRGANKHFGGRLRTHAWSIIRDSPCPVLSL